MYLYNKKTATLLFRGNEDLGSLSGVEQYHLDTRKRDTLDAINRWWQAQQRELPDEEHQRNGVTFGSVDDATVSPDGKWMAWYAFWHGAPGVLMYFALDGKEGYQRPMQQRNPNSVWHVAWSLNSRSWIGLSGYDRRALVRHDITTQQEHRYDFSSRGTLPQVEYTHWELLGREANGHLLLILQKPGYHPNNDVLLADIPRETEQDDARVLTIQMPPHAYSGEVAISPSGNRLVWHLYFVSPDYKPGQPIPKADQEQFGEEIWLSKADGSNMHRLEELVFHDDGKILGEYMGFWGLRWSPDGKHISYMFDRVLYLVDAP